MCSRTNCDDVDEVEQKWYDWFCGVIDKSIKSLINFMTLKLRVWLELGKRRPYGHKYSSLVIQQQYKIKQQPIKVLWSL